MSNQNLDLPFIANIPYSVQISEFISDAEKLYFGQICGLAVKHGYMWASDEQLAKMKGVSIATIERWNKNLELAGFIQRVTENHPEKNSEGKHVWVKKRMIFFADAYSYTLPVEEKVVSSVVSNKDCEPLKNEGTKEPLKNEGTKEPLKNEGIINTSLDSNLRLQTKAPSAIVIFSSLDKLDIIDSLKLKISRENSEADVDLAVDRCLKWTGRENDSLGIQVTLKKRDQWNDVPSPEEKIERNISFLRSFDKYDGKTIARTMITVGIKYIEFVAGMKTSVFEVTADTFRDDINSYFEYLWQCEENDGELCV